jgi:hypothetical protein
MDGTVVFETAPDRPDDSGHLVGDGDSSFVVDVSVGELVGPLAQVIGLCASCVQQDRSGAVNQETAQVGVSALGDASETAA